MYLYYLEIGDIIQNGTELNGSFAFKDFEFYGYMSYPKTFSMWLSDRKKHCCFKDKFEIYDKFVTIMFLKEK